MGLYERLLEEKRILEEADTEGDRERRRRGERASAYLRSRRKAVDAGGYVSSEELRGNEEGRMEELSRLHGLTVRGPSNRGEGYAFAHLRNKYRAEYLQLCRIHGIWAERSLARYSEERSSGEQATLTD